MHEITQNDAFLKEDGIVTDADQTAPVTPPAAPRKTLGLRPGPNRMSHEESMASLFVEYDHTMRVLAGLEDNAETSANASALIG